MDRKSDLRTFVIALLTSIIVIAVYHFGVSLGKLYCPGKSSAAASPCGMTPCGMTPCGMTPCGPAAMPCRVYIVPQGNWPACQPGNCGGKCSAPSCGTGRDKACCSNPGSGQERRD